ncbi:hypothetical protein [Noviherbaspirillum autotrophicum]|uniref:Uncharacterized protein n=1 Tax=Noviherbaspirillum autotrophicum TaxID=709839 RepID=A0A0C1YU08_9BURK|nr:hypothetical protein [Noviherbaspirillum autotrophicum]KIF82712.1 hypothetical protein TSA66_20785 [Noviherbaspirillum autotrophicum]KIF84162.1 hypothetical protein TSA66_00055 [Noviherbaspirillum autotrophicum]
MSDLDLVFDGVMYCLVCGSDKHNYYDSTSDNLCLELNRYLLPHQPRTPAICNMRRLFKGCLPGISFAAIQYAKSPKLYRPWHDYTYNVIFNDSGIVARRTGEIQCYRLWPLHRFASPPYLNNAQQVHHGGRNYVVAVGKVHTDGFIVTIAGAAAALARRLALLILWKPLMIMAPQGLNIRLVRMS